MKQRMDELLENLSKATQTLAQLVGQDDLDVDELDKLLDEREQYMHDIQALIKSGSLLSNSQRIRLERMNEINLGILPQMIIQQQELKQKIESIQQRKTARQFYNQDGPSGYGAFFDKKK